MLISMSDNTFDPVLGSLWGSEDSELDDLRLNKSNPSDCQQDGTTYSPVSPPHSHDSFLGLQLDFTAEKEFVHDWGVLDDEIYRQQLQERAGSTADQEPLTQDEGALHLHTSPDLHAFMSPSADISRSFASVSISSSEPLWTTTNATLSRSGSTSSIQTERGRSRLKGKLKKQKPQPRESSTFQEHVFHSNPARSTSRASASSGRRGPLDSEARAKMSAVKGVGPCWRCKALRKSASP